MNQEVGTMDDPSLGERLAHVREAAGLTQAALAEILDTRQSYISMIETGGRMPSRDLLRRWVEACGRRLDMVFSRADGAPMEQVTHYLDTMPVEHALLVARLVRVLTVIDDDQRQALAETLQGMINMAEGGRAQRR